MRARARHSLPVVLVGLAGLVTAACSAFSSADDAPIVVTPEAEAGDAMTANVVDGDAASATDAPEASTCQGTHDFCASFDDVTTPEQGWSFRDVSNAGSLQLSTANAPPSKPNALLASLFAATQLEKAWLYTHAATWARASNGKQRPLRLSFAVYPDTVGQGFGLIAKHFLGGAPGNEDQLAVALVAPDAGTLAEVWLVESVYDVSAGKYFFPRALATGLHVPERAWTTIVLEVSERSATSAGTVRVTAGTPFTVDLLSTKTRDQLDIGIGLATVGATTNWVVGIDDVVADWTH
jgi:hypothetical protein